MPYKIQRNDEWVEIRLWGETAKDEILKIIHEINRQDPKKELSDVWIVDKESMVPFFAFREIAESVQLICEPGMAGTKSAIVAGDEFHRAQIEMFQAEAKILPYPIGVFATRDEAIEWILA